MPPRSTDGIFARSHSVLRGRGTGRGGCFSPSEASGARGAPSSTISCQTFGHGDSQAGLARSIVAPSS
jgi:hypothetical protein